MRRAVLLLAAALLASAADDDDRPALPPAAPPPAILPPAAPPPVAPPPGAHPAAGPAAGVTLDAAAQARGGIEVAPAALAGPERRPAYATILDLARLAELANNAAAAQAQQQAAQARLEASHAALERAGRLYRDQQNVSAADYQAAQAAYRADQAAAAVAAAQLRLVGDTVQREWGAVLRQAVLDDAPVVQRLLSGQAVLVEVSLPAGPTAAPEGARLAGPDGAEVALTYLCEAARADPRLQGTSYLYTAPARAHLVPGLNLSAVMAGAGGAAAAVPESAVVRWQGGDWIYVRTGPSSFARRPVATGRPADGGYAVEGLAPGTPVVVRGAQLLLSEEFKAQGQTEDEN